MLFRSTVAELPELGAGSIAEFEGVPVGDAGAGGAGRAGADAGAGVGAGTGAGVGAGAGAGSPDGREFAAQLTAEVEQLRRERLG